LTTAGLSMNLRASENHDIGPEAIEVW